jgi:hypothetical protein
MTDNVEGFRTHQILLRSKIADLKRDIANAEKKIAAMAHELSATEELLAFCDEKVASCPENPVKNKIAILIADMNSREAAKKNEQ